MVWHCAMTTVESRLWRPNKSGVQFYLVSNGISCTIRAGDAMTSTQLCLLLRISSKTLYLWESAGKIPKSTRDRRGWRVYGPDQVKAIKKFAQGTGKNILEPVRYENRVSPRLSARNQIRGKVVSVRADGLLCEVVLRLEDGQEIVSIITKSSVQRLGIKKGDTAFAVVKSTEVMLLK